MAENNQVPEENTPAPTRRSRRNSQSSSEAVTAAEQAASQAEQLNTAEAAGLSSSPAPVAEANLGESIPQPPLAPPVVPAVPVSAPVSQAESSKVPEVPSAPAVPPAPPVAAGYPQPPVNYPTAPAGYPQPGSTNSQPQAPGQYPQAQTGQVQPGQAQSPYYPQPQPLEAPRRRGNRVFGIIFSVIATLLFAGALYWVMLLLHANGSLAYGYQSDVTLPEQSSVNWTWYLSLPAFYLAVVGFLVGQLILVLILNRASWVTHAVGSFFVGIFALAGHLVGRYLESSNWAADSWQSGEQNLAVFLWFNLLTVFSLLVFIIARELSFWTGLVLSLRGSALKRRYDREVVEYEEKKKELAKEQL